MNIKNLIFLSLSILVISSSNLYAGSRSQSFGIKVYLPAIAGVNAPLEESENQTLTTFTNADTQLQTFTEEKIRNHKRIILKTVVPK